MHLNPPKAFGRKFYPAIIASLILLGLVMEVNKAVAQSADVQPRMKLDYFRDSLIGGVIKRELSFSIDELGKPGDPIPKYILGNKVGGDYMLMSIGETMASVEQLTGAKGTNQYPFVKFLKPWMLAEAPVAHTFGQLFMIRSLLMYQSKGTKPVNSLKGNPIWESLTGEEQKTISAGLDFRRSYDVVKREPSNGRPLNYLAVGLLIGAYGKSIGLDPDPEALDDLANKCADIIYQNNGILDDDKGGRGRYDRYGREFNHFTWEALTLLGKNDLLVKIKPAVINSNQIWFDMVNPATGYGYPYGRSLQNSWDDTFEQCGFLATYPELSPAPLPLIAALYAKAWDHYITNQYNPTKHLNRMLEPGRGTYSYASADRIWGYTVHTFGKVAMSALLLFAALDKNKISSWTIKPELPPVSRFVPITHKNKSKKMGWWIVRNPGNYFVLPIVGSFKNSATSDYLPIPYGFEGIQVPVAQQVPTMVPFLSLPDGTTLSTADGADSIYLNQDGNKLTIVWRNLVDVKGNNNKFGIGATVSWTYQDQEIINEISINSMANTVISKLQYWVPTNYSYADLASGSVFNTDGKQLYVNLTTDWDCQLMLMSPGHTDLGKGPFAPIPLIMQWTGTDVPLLQDKTYKLKVSLRSAGF